MTEKLTFEKIRDAAKNLKEGEELWLESKHHNRVFFVGFGASGCLVIDGKEGRCANSYKEEQIGDWQIILPEKKKVKLYQAVFRDDLTGDFYMASRLFKDSEQANKYNGHNFVQLIDPAICEIEEE